MTAAVQPLESARESKKSTQQLAPSRGSLPFLTCQHANSSEDLLSPSLCVQGSACASHGQPWPCSSPTHAQRMPLPQHSLAGFVGACALRVQFVQVPWQVLLVLLVLLSAGCRAAAHPSRPAASMQPSLQRKKVKGSIRCNWMQGAPGCMVCTGAHKMAGMYVLVLCMRMYVRMRAHTQTRTHTLARTRDRKQGLVPQSFRQHKL